MKWTLRRRFPLNQWLVLQVLWAYFELSRSRTATRNPPGSPSQAHPRRFPRRLLRSTQRATAVVVVDWAPSVSSLGLKRPQKALPRSRKASNSSRASPTGHFPSYSLHGARLRELWKLFHCSQLGSSGSEGQSAGTEFILNSFWNH